MSRPHPRRPILVLLGPCLLAMALLAGCASPKPVLFSLDAVPGPVVTAPRHVILVRQVSVARYLDRSPIVRSSAGYRLQLYGNDWWGELPGPMVTRVLAADLASRLPAGTVLPETIALTVTPDISVEVLIQRFDENSSGTLVLSAAFSLLASRGGPPPETFDTSVAPPSPDVIGQVAAMSEALGRLADTIALRIAALHRG